MFFSFEISCNCPDQGRRIIGHKGLYIFWQIFSQKEICSIWIFHETLEKSVMDRANMVCQDRIPLKHCQLHRQQVVATVFFLMFQKGESIKSFIFCIKP